MQSALDQVYQGAFFLDLALPNDVDVPPLCRQDCDIPGITDPGNCDLWLPVIEAGARQAPFVAADVAVPETTMHKNRRSPTWDDNVGPPSQVLPVQPIGQSGRSEDATHL